MGNLFGKKDLNNENVLESNNFSPTKMYNMLMLIKDLNPILYDELYNLYRKTTRLYSAANIVFFLGNNSGLPFGAVQF